MFDNINAGLSKLINKVSKTELKGEKLENFIEELKLVLIQNDVALPVADSLCMQLEKKVKTLTIRRFGDVRKSIRDALRDILLDLLKTKEKINFLEILESKKMSDEPAVIVFVGVNGTGKCVNSDSLIPVFEGGLKPIEDIYKESAKRGVRLDDGEESVVINPEAELETLSIDLESCRIKEVSPSVLWKIRNREPLLRIEFSNDLEIQVTPEHPFFIRRNGKILKVNAENLVKNSHAMVINKNCIVNRRLNQAISWAKVKRVETSDEPKYVYDLTVPHHHNFIANGIVVHNTTSIAKLAHLLLKRNYSAVIACSDTYRPGSIEQLEEHARRIGVKAIKHRYGADAAAVAYDSINYARSKGVNAVLIDTAGRMQTNKNLLDEMKKIVRVSEPDLTILVVDALTGNDAVEQGKIFNATIKLDGIILAKLDADAKGGSAISLSHITGKPILFVGTGQKYDDLIEFDSKFIINNIFTA